MAQYLELGERHRPSREQLEQLAIRSTGIADHEVVVPRSDQVQIAFDRERLDRGPQPESPPARGAYGRCGRRVQYPFQNPDSLTTGRSTVSIFTLAHLPSLAM